MKSTERLLRAIFERLVTRGALDVFLPSGKFSIGDGAAPQAAIRIADNAAVAELLRDPEMKFGELFVDGRLTVAEGDLATVIALLFQHGATMRRDTTRKTYDVCAPGSPPRVGRQRFLAGAAQCGAPLRSERAILRSVPRR